MSRVLVIGGGIAGSAVALGLHKAGAEVTVYEAHRESGADLGAFMTLASNGMLALAQLDAADAVARRGFPLTTLRVSDDTGAQVAVAPMGRHDEPLARYRCMRRADLCAALQETTISRGIAVLHDRRCVAVHDDGAQVTATFADGSTERGDLLIGADGLNSAVRQQITPDAPPPRYAGQRVFYGYSDTARPPHTIGQIEMIRGSASAFGYAVSPTGTTYWFARVPGDPLPPDEIAAGTPARWREQLLPLLYRDTTPAAAIVAETWDELLVTNATDLAHLAAWRTARTLLVGDAAHAASPATGQGASMALEDAVVLAKALRHSTGSTSSIGAALELYERVRRPRVEQNTAVSARLTASRVSDRVQRASENQEVMHRAARLQRGNDPAAAADEELIRQLDWHSPLTS